MKSVAKMLRTTLVMASAMYFQMASAVDFIPFAGFEGYQELQVTNDIYFVAFHGRRDSQAAEVELAMKVRAAQLCNKNSRDYFIQLKYPFEPVLKTDTPLASWVADQDYVLQKARGGGFIYIPIYTPRSSGSVTIDAPSRMGHVRCVGDAALALDSSRVVNGKALIEEAGSLGWGAQTQSQ